MPFFCVLRLYIVKVMGKMIMDGRYLTEGKVIVIFVHPKLKLKWLDKL
jgi:hypothetical protein